MPPPRSTTGGPPPPRTPPVARIIATFFHSGFFPWAPATLASLIVAVIYWFLPPLPTYLVFISLAVVTWVGVITATMAEKELGLDAHPIVIDEVAGMMVTYLLVPVPGEPLARVAVLFAGFALFRVFDIVKPWPIGRLQSLPAGWGIMMDDLAAGLLSNVVLRILLLAGFLKLIPGLRP